MKNTRQKKKRNHSLQSNFEWGIKAIERIEQSVKIGFLLTVAKKRKKNVYNEYEWYKLITC